jgi:hypothetical protein
MSNTIRPFRGLDALQVLLDGTEFLVNGKRSLGRVTMTPDEVRDATADARLVLDRAAYRNALAVAGLSLDDVEVLAFRLGGSGRLLELNRVETKSSDRSIIVSTTRDGAKIGDPLHGEESSFSLGASIVLAKDLEKKRFRPYLKGTWLAEARLDVRAHDEAVAGPQLRQLNDEEVAALRSKGIRVGLDTLTYVDFTQKLLSAPLVSAVTIYVNEGLGLALKRHEETKSDEFERRLRFHMSRVAVDATVAIATKVAEEIAELEPEDLDDVARIRTAIQGSEGLVRFLSHYFVKSDWGRGLERESAAAEVVHLAHRAPADLRPMLEQCVGLGEHLPDVLGGKQ